MLGLDFLDDLEIDLNVICVSVGIYAVILFGLWKVDIAGGWSLQYKIILSVMFAPITFIIVNIMDKK